MRVIPEVKTSAVKKRTNNPVSNFQFIPWN